MPSFNHVMQLWHAYVKVDKHRVNLGYYATQQDAQEAQDEGKPTEKRVSSGKRGRKSQEKRIPSDVKVEQ